MHASNLTHKVIILALGAMLLGACAGLDPALLDQAGSLSKIEGILTSMSSDIWTVGDVPIQLTDDTEIKGEIRLGDKVVIEAELNDDGSAVAFEISLSQERDEFEFFGQVSLISDEMWVVGEHELRVGPFTEIKGAISLGEMVKVHAFFNGEGLLVAREIEPALEADEHDDDDADERLEVEFFGVVVTIGAESWVVGEMTFAVTESTEIEEDIVEGDFVKVEALQNEDGSFVALEIEREDDEHCEDLSDLDLEDCDDMDAECDHLEDHDACELDEHDDDEHDDDEDDDDEDDDDDDHDEHEEEDDD